MPEVELEIELGTFVDDKKTLKIIEEYALVFLRMGVAVKSVSALVNAYLKGISLQEDVIRDNKNISNTESKKEKRKRRQKATTQAMESAQAMEIAQAEELKAISFL